MTAALFINGTYDAVLSEILAARKSRRGSISFLQPHKGQVISMLRNAAPPPDAPIRLYISTSANFSSICYPAESVGWEDKRELSTRRRKEVKKHLRRHQQRETDLVEGS
jgi:hypothetical protein